MAGKPVQLWTQGKTNANAVWLPTIDQPNQKTTSKISPTVPAKNQTLSKGQPHLLTLPTGGDDLTLISNAIGTVVTLSDLPTGVYTVRIHAQEGTVVKRLMRE